MRVATNSWPRTGSSMASRLPPPCSIRRRRWAPTGCSSSAAPPSAARPTKSRPSRPPLGRAFWRHVRPMRGPCAARQRARGRRERPAGPADLIVTIGGGTPIDTAKILLMCLPRTSARPRNWAPIASRWLDDGSKRVPAVKAPPIRQIVVRRRCRRGIQQPGGCSDPLRQVKDLYTGRLIGAQGSSWTRRLTVHTP